MLYIFPDSIPIGLDDHAALYCGVINQLCFLYDVGIPLCKIFLHGSNGFNKFLLFRHVFLLFCDHCAVIFYVILV